MSTQWSLSEQHGKRKEKKKKKKEEQEVFIYFKEFLSNYSGLGSFCPVCE